VQTVRTWLIIVGTFLPVIATVVTVALAIRLRGRRRWLVLWLVPAAGCALTFAVAHPVLQDGNLLAALLYGFYWMALSYYYPILLVVAGIQFLRRRARKV
jgi:hypothetical protein